MNQQIRDMKACQRRFFTHLADAVLHLTSSRSQAARADSDISSRSSVLSSILSLESAANSCIYHLQLASSVLADAERFTILGKFDYFLLHMRQRHLDRGDSHVKQVAEIIRVRNDAFHSKIRSGTFGPDGNARFGSTETLRIPYDIRRWNAPVATRVLRALVDFYNWYFVGQCALHKGVVTTMLTCYEEELSSEQIHTFLAVEPGLFSNLRRVINRQIKFVDIRPSQPAAPPVPPLRVGG